MILANQKARPFDLLVVNSFIEANISFDYEPVPKMHGDDEVHESGAADVSSGDERPQSEEAQQRESAVEKNKEPKPQQQQEEEDPVADGNNAEEAEVTEHVISSTLFEVPIEKTEKGKLGIYFTKRESDSSTSCLVVDGFVDDDTSQHGKTPADEDDNINTEAEAEAESDSRQNGIRELLQLGDVLVSVNGVDCLHMEIMETIALLRAAPLGSNTLQFSRECPQLEKLPENNDSESTGKKHEEVSASITKSFIGALRKVKTKIREGIEGDEELLAREQEEKELFEKSWLAEFDRLKGEYDTKWETCTYTADEFCGLLYHSGDPQQKEYLLREYPLLMNAWKNANLSATSIRVRPDWPAPRAVYTVAIEYYHCPAMLSGEIDGDMDNDHNGSQPLVPPQTRDIHLSPHMYRVMNTLRQDFSWRRNDIHAFAKRLEAGEILSCSNLVQALEARGSRFESAFQSVEYPRLTTAMCRSLLAYARHAAKSHEDLRGMPDLKQLK